jgi:hypothetical protein
MSGYWVESDFYCTVYNGYGTGDPHDTNKPWCFIGHFDWLTKMWAHLTIPHIDSFEDCWHLIVSSNGIMNMIEATCDDPTEIRPVRIPIK